MRAHLRRELVKEKNTKSVQSTDNLYSGNWVYYNKLASLLPVIGECKSRDTLNLANLQENDNEASTWGTPAVKRKKIAKRKLKLLSKCAAAITGNAKAPKKEKFSAFSLYIKEMLSQLDKHRSRVAEKCISNVLFQIEMLADLSAECEVNRQ